MDSLNCKDSPKITEPSFLSEKDSPLDQSRRPSRRSKNLICVILLSSLVTKQGWDNVTLVPLVFCLFCQRIGSWKSQNLKVKSIKLVYGQRVGESVRYWKSKSLKVNVCSMLVATVRQATVSICCSLRCCIISRNAAVTRVERSKSDWNQNTNKQMWVKNSWYVSCNDIPICLWSQLHDVYISRLI